MRKVIFSEFGGPEVLRVVDAEEPHAGAGQIRVAVRAAGVNPVDWRIREGQRQATHPISLPSGIGQDAAGIVDEIGDGIDDLARAAPGEGCSTHPAVR